MTREEKRREQNCLDARKRRAKDPEKDRTYQREYRIKNKDVRRQRVREYLRLKVYGLTPEAYNKLFGSQRYACAICTSASSGSKHDWHVDHCHKTGVVRGILCRHCNQVLANAKDNITTLQAAINYLKGNPPMADFNQRVAQYVKLRDLIKVKETEFKERMAPYKKTLEDLNSVLLNHLNQVGANSVNTDAGTVYRTEKKSASLHDPAAFMEHVIGNEAWDLLDRKANVTAVAAFIEENNALPPGVNFSTAYVVGVRRPEQEK